MHTDLEALKPRISHWQGVWQGCLPQFMRLWDVLHKSQLAGQHHEHAVDWMPGSIWIIVLNSFVINFPIFSHICPNFDWPWPTASFFLNGIYMYLPFLDKPWQPVSLATCCWLRDSVFLLFSFPYQLVTIPSINHHVYLSMLMYLYRLFSRYLYR